MDEKEAIRKAMHKYPKGANILLDLVSEGLLTVGEPAKNEPCCIGAGFWPSLINGSVRDTCDRCNRYVALTPSTQAMMRGRTAETNVMCPVCLPEFAKEQAE